MNLLVHVDFASYICLNFNLVINIVRAFVYIYSLQLSQYPINVVSGASMSLEYLFTPISVQSTPNLHFLNQNQQLKYQSNVAKLLKLKKIF